MNSDVLKYSSNDCQLTNKPYKRSKRKRRRNKYKNTNSRIRRKYQKRFQSSNKIDYSSSPGSRVFHFADSFRLGGRKIMSNWYWSNYKKAFEWQDKHRVAHWKACALALQEENKYLLHIINSMRPGLCPNLPVTFQNLHRKVDVNKINREIAADAEVENYENDEEGSDEIEFEMSEEMMQFFEQSFKHKMELEEMKKQKQQLNDTEEEVKQIQTSRLKRSSEMQSLYGDQASMITGMETAVQLSFEKYCDTKSPKYWPNIPFRL